MKKISWPVVITGGLVGLAAVLLTAFGNPANMGFCIACFLRDITGSVGMHSAAKVQYMRPEIVGLVLGAFIMAIATKEFRAKSGSSPAIRFVLGAFVMIGALAFLGCPLRMVLRMAGGDANALIAFIGFALGIYVGTLWLNKGFSLKRSHDAGAAEGGVLTAVMVGLMVLFLLVPTLFKVSEAGPGSKAAPVAVALLISLIVGALAQKSRLCMAGGLRDAFMFRDFKLLYGFAAIFLVALIGNLITNSFKFGFEGQPVAHSDHVWSFLGMAVVGWGSVLLGGCPMRQLILAGSGNGDAAVTVFGMIVGAAISHNFGLAGTAADAANGIEGGVSTAGRVAILIGLAVLLVVSMMHMPKAQKKA